MASGVGNATLDFGAAPGTNMVSVAVTGQAAIGAGSYAEAFVMSDDTTADHNAYEHRLAPFTLRCEAIIAGTGFTIVAFSDYRLTGQFKVRWVWAD